LLMKLPPELQEMADQYKEQEVDEEHETMMMIEKLTREGAAAVVGDLLGASGKMGEDKPAQRPWMYVSTDTEEEAREIQEAFGFGFVKPHATGSRWRWGCLGNSTLEVLHDVLAVDGFRGVQKKQAYHLLDKYGDHGQPYPNEILRIRARKGI
jgi:hypothetical protein